jgi:hypothetical protein
MEIKMLLRANVEQGDALQLIAGSSDGPAV